MAKGAVKARKAKRKAEQRDARVRELLDGPVLAALEDWDLLICDGCGLEQSRSSRPCIFCGCETATGAPRARVDEFRRAARKFSL